MGGNTFEMAVHSWDSKYCQNEVFLILELPPRIEALFIPLRRGRLRKRYWGWQRFGQQLLQQVIITVLQLQINISARRPRFALLSGRGILLGVIPLLDYFRRGILLERD